MKRKKFMIKILLEKEKNETFEEITSMDYDEEIGLVRYKDVLYDIELGLWALSLRQLKNGYGVWKTYGSGIAQPQATLTTMLQIASESKSFMNNLSRARQKARDAGAKIMNKIEKDYNLFSI